MTQPNASPPPPTPATPTDVTEAELAELERLEQAATAVPWEARDGKLVCVYPPDSQEQYDSSLAVDGPTGSAYGVVPHGILFRTDAQVIAAARNALPRLLSELRRRRAAPSLQPGGGSAKGVTEAEAEAAEFLRGLKGDDGSGPMAGLEPREFYDRYEDMSPDGKLSILIEDDGDVILTAVPPAPSSLDDRPPEKPVSVQFCTSYSGGGQSPKVREAILRLAQAIKADNEANPQYRDVAPYTPSPSGAGAGGSGAPGDAAEGLGTKRGNDET